MTNIFSMLDNMTDMIEEYVLKQTEVVRPPRLGLDNRCGSLYVNEDCIIVPTYNDKQLQYYGGFEYVSKEYRFEVPGYVIYTGEDDRVRGCIDRYLETQFDDTPDEE